MKTCAVLLLIAFAAIGHAEDWFVKGKVYNNVSVTQVNPDSVSVNFDGGTGRLALADLPPDIAKRFTADAKKAQVFALLEKRAETDPIDHLIVSLGTDGMWINGMSVNIKAPATATPAELLAAFGASNRAYSYATTATILETRQIQIDPMPQPYTAVRIRSTEGEKIILFQYEDGGKGIGFWWNRPFASGY